MMKFVVTIFFLMWMTQFGFSADEIKELKINNKDFVFTASWQPLSATNYDESDSITYTLFAIALDSMDDFAPVQNCENISESSCVIDPDIYDYIRLEWTIDFKVNAVKGNEIVGISSIIYYTPDNDDDTIISSPKMNITRDGRNVSVHFENIPYTIDRYDPHLEIESFGNLTDKEKYLYKTEAILGYPSYVVSWITRAPENVSICVRARYRFESHGNLEGEWAQECVQVDESEPQAYTDGEIPNEAYSLTVLVALAVVFGLIFLILLIVGTRFLFVKYYRNPFQDTNLALPIDTLTATHVDENDAIVLTVQPPEKYDNIRGNAEDSSNNFNHSDDDNENLFSVSPLIATSDTEILTQQQVPVIQITPIRDVENADLPIKGRARVESADSAFCDSTSALMLPGARRSREGQFFNNERCSPLHESPVSCASCESVFLEDEGYVRVPNMAAA